MKRYPLAIVLVFVVYGCASPPSVVTEGHIVYYGFAAVDCLWDDPHDMFSKTNYVDEVAGFTNLAQLCVFSEQEPLETRLNAFHTFGIKALLSVEPLLFDRQPDSSSPSGERITLSSEAQARWMQFIEINEPWLTPDYVAAIHLADEPVWNSLSDAEFAQAISIVKASLPTLPTVAIEAYPVLEDLVVPDSLDWIGFGRYGHRDPSTDPLWLADLETLKAKLNPEQKLVIVAETQWLPQYEDAGMSAADMARVVENYLNVARANPETVALIGYTWPGGLDDPGQLGARDLPTSVLETLKSIGHRILKP